MISFNNQIIIIHVVVIRNLYFKLYYLLKYENKTKGVGRFHISKRKMFYTVELLNTEHFRSTNVRSLFNGRIISKCLMGKCVEGIQAREIRGV